MEKHIKLILILLSASLILNFYTISKINQMSDLTKREIRSLIEGIVEDDLEDINEEIKQIKENQRWISYIEVSQVGADGNMQTYKFNWSIKDYKLDSKVIFYCRNSENDTYEQFDVNEISQGNYVAELQITFTDGPEWVIRYTDNSGHINTIKNISPNIYEYYVALEDGDHIVTSGVESINLSKLSQPYSEIHAEIMTNKENKPMQVKLFINENKINTKNLILEVHNGNSKEEFSADNEKLWGSWVLTNKAFDKLIIRAEYENGETFNKEIWNESN